MKTKHGALLLGIGLLAATPRADENPPLPNFDLVIRGGRVMDPESGLDEVRDVGVVKGRIVAVSAESLRGTATIDARGLVVAPGFVDLHAHGVDAENYALRASDGVTTSLELEIGTADVDGF